MNIARYIHTLRHLRPVQIYGRVWFKQYRGRPDERAAPRLRVRSGLLQQPCARAPSMPDAMTFRFLNTTCRLSTWQGWNDPSVDKLWLYNLHYFDDLNSSDSAVRGGWHRSLIDRWIAENPPPRGNGWEPYPTSLRIVNWVKWSLAGNALEAGWVHSLAVQVRWLRNRLEWYLLGNHLLANAKALAIAGLFFEGEEADRWLETGLRIYRHELAEQVLPDGGNFERSPMYHAIILEDLLDLINLAGVFPGRVPAGQLASWRDSTQRMLEWLAVMTHPDGEIAFFNDAATGIAPTLMELTAYAGRLGLTLAAGRSGTGRAACVAVAASPSSAITQLPDSGYVRLSRGDATALLDVGPIGPDYQPGHAHADTLSFELSLFGQRVMVNSGTSCYGISAERLRQRGTAAHNTVTVDGQDSSEVWGGFRVARRARPILETVSQSGDAARVAASHDGYKRLPGRNIHRRQWTLSPNDLRIQDAVSGPFRQARARFHVHPGVQVETLDLPAGKLTLRLPQGPVVQFAVDGAASLAIEPATWHPEFGVAVTNFCIVATFETGTLNTRIAWQSD